MLPPDMEHYLSEVSRVLKPGGRCLITFFVLNQESLGLINEQRTVVPFAHDCGEHRISSTEAPELAVAYPESAIRLTYARRGLAISEPIRYGSWCNRAVPYDYQDIIIAVKQQ